MFTTINELIFPVFLFAVYFCTASIVFYNSKPSHRSRQDVVEPEQEENVEIQVTANNVSQEVKPKSPIETSSIEPAISAPIQMAVPQVPDSSLVETQSFKELHAQADRIISHLNSLRSRRTRQPDSQLASALGKEQGTLPAFFLVSLAMSHNKKHKAIWISVLNWRIRST